MAVAFPFSNVSHSSLPATRQIEGIKVMLHHFGIIHDESTCILSFSALMGSHSFAQVATPLPTVEPQLITAVLNDVHFVTITDTMDKVGEKI